MSEEAKKEENYPRMAKSWLVAKVRSNFFQWSQTEIKNLAGAVLKAGTTTISQ